MTDPTEPRPDDGPPRYISAFLGWTLEDIGEPVWHSPEDGQRGTCWTEDIDGQPHLVIGDGNGLGIVHLPFPFVDHLLAKYRRTHD